MKQPRIPRLHEQLSPTASHWRAELLPNQRDSARCIIARLLREPETPLALKQVHCELSYMPTTIHKAALYIQRKWPKIFEYSPARGKQKASIGTMRCIAPEKLQQANEANKKQDNQP